MLKYMFNLIFIYSTCYIDHFDSCGLVSSQYIYIYSLEAALGNIYCFQCLFECPSPISQKLWT